MIVSKKSTRDNMWTEITRSKYERAGRRYASDLADAEWRLIEPYICWRPSVWAVRGKPIFAPLSTQSCISRTGCQWRLCRRIFRRLPQCKAISTIGGTRACSSGSILNCCSRHARPLAANPVPLLASSTANRSRPPKAADHEVMMRPRKSEAVSAVCHEHADRVAEVWSSMRDEGRPLEVGSQVQASNRSKLRPSRATVVSVAEKPGQDLGRYDPERRAQANRR